MLARADRPLLLLAALLAVACGESERTGGNSKLGYFQAQVPAFPVGGQLDFVILDWELDAPPAPTQVRDVRSRRPAIVDVVSAAADGRVLVSGRGAGEAEVGFNGDSDGESIDDAFVLSVVAPTRLEWGPCAAGDSGLVAIRGKLAAFPFTLTADDERPLGSVIGSAA